MNFMPRYFFNVYSGSESFIDEDGEEFPDNHAAWREATSTAGLSIKDLNGRLLPDSQWRLDVMDEFQNQLYCIIVISRRSP